MAPPTARYVQEEEVVTPPPRRPLLWPWALLLLALVATALAAAYLLTRDDGKAATKAEVPNVVGLSTAAAVRKLGQRGYATIVQGRTTTTERPGTVLAQQPPAGTELDRGGRVTIVVARGPSTVEVPKLVGLQVDQAFVRLQSAGFKGQSVKVASTQPKGRVLRQAPAGGSQAKKGSTVVLTTSKGASLVKVPALRGLTEASATATLNRLGFRLSVSRIGSTLPKGIVISQEPAPGTKAPKGSIVGINVSNGSKAAASGVTVPDVVGLGQASAIDKIEQAGLKADSFPVASSKPRGSVVSQLPAADTQVPPRSLVRINVSLGPGTRPMRTVPDVLGEAEADAKRTLARAGFTVRTAEQPTSDPAENGIVVKQKPSGGEKAAAGSQIVIYVGRLPSPSD